jgi:hypothetical protein
VATSSPSQRALATSSSSPHNSTLGAASRALEQLSLGPAAVPIAAGARD